jgi:putative redox protein
MVKVDIEYTGNLHCDATHGPSQSKIATDAPTDNKGKGEAFSPTDLVATALGTCISTTMGLKAEELGVDLRGMTVSVQKEMSHDAPRRIGGLPSEFTLRCRQLHRIAKFSNKPGSIVPCTRVCRRK